MTVSMRWPNNMATLRNNSAEIALTGAGESEILMKKARDRDELAAAAKVHGCFLKIAMNLTAAGAPVMLEVIEKGTVRK